MKSILFKVFILLSGSAMGRPSTGVYPRSEIGIFPIEECPVNTLYPQVIILPSVDGQQVGANQYVMCYGGVPHIFNCSQGLFFNWEKMSCDYTYERRSPQNSEDSQNGQSPDIIPDDLIPAGPIQVPNSPQYPIPIWSRRGRVIQDEVDLPFVRPPIYPYPTYPITRPDPDVILPIPVLPSHPLPPAPRPVPYL